MLKWRYWAEMTAILSTMSVSLMLDATYSQ